MANVWHAGAAKPRVRSCGTWKREANTSLAKRAGLELGRRVERRPRNPTGRARPIRRTGKADFSSDGTANLLVSAAQISHWTRLILELREAATGRLINRLPEPEDSTFLAISPDLETLVERREDNALLLRDVPTGRVRARPVQPRQRGGRGSTRTAPWEGAGAKFNEDGTLLATWDAEGNFRVWDLRPPLEHARFPGMNLTFNADGSRFVVVKGSLLWLGPWCASWTSPRARPWPPRTHDTEFLANLDRFSVLPTHLSHPGPHGGDTDSSWLLYSADRKTRVASGWEGDQRYRRDREHCHRHAACAIRGSGRTKLGQVEAAWNGPEPRWPVAGVPDGPGQGQSRRPPASRRQMERHIKVKKDEVSESPGCLAFSPDGKILAVGTEEGLQFVDPAKGNVAQGLRQGTGLYECGVQPRRQDAGDRRSRRSALGCRVRESVCFVAGAAKASLLAEPSAPTGASWPPDTPPCPEMEAPSPGMKWCCGICLG